MGFLRPHKIFKHGTLLTFAAMTALFSPLAPPHAHASKITDANGNSLTSSDRLHQIYLQQRNGSIGLNRFKDFQLSSGEIANMHFNKANEKKYADILVNLVRNKIDIGGTVNAIRNGTIDGHLIFVSPSGIALTKSGVINAGRFTGMVPTTSHFNTLWDTKIDKFDKNFVLANIDVNGSGNTSYISNTQGIDIQGVINTRSGIGLSANSINVGENAKLIAKTNLDFTNLVNLEGVDSGIKEVKVTKTSAGDIFLRAHAYTTEALSLKSDAIIGGNPRERTNKASITMNGTIETDRDVRISATAKQLVTDENFKLLSDPEQQNGFLWSRISWAEAEANIGGTIKARNININATANTSFIDADNALVTTRDAIGIVAPDEGYIRSVLNLAEYVNTSIAVKFNKATVNVTDKADLQAQKNLNISANADLNVDISAELKPSAAKGVNNIPRGTLTFAYYDNAAIVNVNGKISADNDIKITADANTTIKEKSTAKAKKAYGVDDADNGKVYLGMNFAIGNTNAEINLDSKDTIKAGKNLTVAATAKPTFDVSATSEVDDKGAIGAAFNYVNDDTTATVLVDSDIDSGGKVNISATQAISDKSATELSLGKADNYFAKADSKYEATTNGYTFLEGLKNLSSDLTKLFKSKILGLDVKDENKSGAREGFSADQVSNLISGEQFKAGAAVSYFGQAADTNVTIGDNVKITAKGNVDISAKTEITKLNLTSTSTVNSANGAKDDPTKNLIGTSLNISNINHNAFVDAGTDSTIDSKGSVKISSSSKMSYNPFTAQMEEVSKNFNKFVDGLKNLGKDIIGVVTNNNYKTREEKLTKINQLLKASEDKKSAADKMSEEQYDNFMGIIEGWLDTYESVKNDPAKSKEALNALNEISKVLKEAGGDLDDYAKEKLETDKAKELQKQSSVMTKITDRVESALNIYNTYTDGTKLIKSLTQSINPATYTNYYSRTANNAKNPNTNDTATFSGSINFNRLNNRATFLAQNGFKINAVGNVDINSNSDTSTVTITGEGGMLGSLNSSYGNSTGVTFNYQNVGSNALTVLGKSDIKGKNLNIGTTNTESQVSIINSASSSDGSRYQSMINIVNGRSNSVTTIDNQSAMVATKNFDVLANNKTNGLAINGALNLGKESTKNNVGVGATWLDIDSNAIANVVRLDDFDAHTVADKQLNAGIKITQTLAKEAEIKLPTAGNTIDKGLITANNINVNANTSGTLLGLVLEGSASTNRNSTLNSFAGTTSGVLGGAASLAKLIDKYTKWPQDKLNKTIGTKISPKEAPAAKEFTEPIERASIPDAASSHVSGAGSFAFTFGDNRASANLDNLKINSTGDDSKLNLLAGDNTFRGALTGSAAINIFSGDASNGASQKSFNAGVAFNKSTTNVDSVISSSDIINSQLLTNVAQSSGSDVAVGLSGGMNSSSSGKQNAFTTDFSFNYSNNNVHALLIENELTGNKTALTNYAFNDRIQISGGIGAHYSRGGQGGNNGSFSIAYSHIKNDVQSGIEGGKYSKLTAADVQAVKAQMQISSAVGLGFSSSSDSNSNEGSITAAIAWQNNHSDAFIKSATIDATEKGQSPLLEITKAQDTDKYKAFHHYTDTSAKTELFKDETGNYYTKNYSAETFIKDGKNYKAASDSSVGTRYIKVNDKYVEAAKDADGYYTRKTYSGKIYVRLNDFNGGVNVLSYETKNNSSWNEYLTKRGLDLSGSSAIGSNEKSSANLTDIRGGSSNVVFALGVNASSKNAGGIGLLLDYDYDKISSTLEKNTITAPNVNVGTRRKLDNISIASGIAIGNSSWGGGGSISLNFLDNQNVVTLTNNNIKANNFNSQIRNDANIFNLAGQGSGGSSGIIGAAIAVNSMDNSSTSQINGGKFTPLNNSINVKVNALNDTASTVIAIAGGAAVDGSSGNFSAALNFGKNSTQALNDNLTIDKANVIEVDTTDRNLKTTLGGTFDYTNGAMSIGATYTHSGDTSEKLRAELNNSTITTAENNPKINVTAYDNSRRRTWAASLGLTRGDSSILTFKGAVANVYSDKDIIAKMHNSSVDTAGEGKSELAIKAQNISSNTTRAGILSLSSSKANFGLGFVRNSLRQDTLADFSFDSVQDKASTFNNFDMRAINNSDISSWAGGSTVSSQGAANATGSFIYNYIGQKSGAGRISSTISNANIISANNISSISQSDLAITNRAGSADINLFGIKSGFISAGVTIAVNDIDDHTTANIENSTLTANAQNKSVNVSDQINDNALAQDRVFDKAQFMFSENSLLKGRKSRNLTGVVVNATSTHAIANDVLNVAGGSTADATGIFNHNYIKGKTQAALNESTINGGKNVNVRAADWSNLGTFEIGGALSLGKGLAASASFAENGNTIDRTIKAQVIGEEQTQQNINAQNFSVTAESKNAIVNTAAGVGLSFAQLGNVGLGVNVIHNALKAKTSADVKNVNVQATGDTTISADNLSRAYKTSGAASVAIGGQSAGAVGILLDYLDQQSTSQITLDYVTLKSKNVNINAQNNTNTDAWLGVVGVGGGGVSSGALSGSFALNYYDATTKVAINHTDINADTVAANAINTSNLNDSSGTIAVAIAGEFSAAIGINSVFNGVASKTTVDLDSVNINAKTTELKANDRRNIDVLDANVSAGVAGFGVNYMATYVNQSLTKDEEIVKQINETLKKMVEKQGKESVEKLDNDQFKLDYIEIALKEKVDEGAGVNVTARSSKLGGSENLNVEATEQNRIHHKAFNVIASHSNLGVGMSYIETKHAVGTKFIDSNLSGKNISVKAGVGNYNMKNPVNSQTELDRKNVTQTTSNNSTKKAKTYTEELREWSDADEATTAAKYGLYNFDFALSVATGGPEAYFLDGVAVSILPSNVFKTGIIGAKFDGTDIKAENKLDIETADMSVMRSRNVAIGIATGGNVQVINADAKNETASNIDFFGNDNTVAAKNISVSTTNAVNQSVVSDAHLASIFVNVPVTLTKTNDISRANIYISDKYKFEGETAKFEAKNNPVVRAESLQNPYLAAVQMNYSGTTAKANSKAEIEVDDDSTFNIEKIEFNATIGENGKPTAYVEHRAHKALQLVGSELSSHATAETDTNATVQIGSETYKDSEVAINAINNASRKIDTVARTYFSGVNKGGVADGNSIAKDSASASAGGGILKNLEIKSSVNNYTDNYAHSVTPFEVVGASNKAQAHNYFSGNASAKLSGTWKAENINISATNEDAVDTMSEAGGVQGVGVNGMSNDITIGKLNSENKLADKELTTVTIAAGTKIDAANLDVSAKNIINTSKNGKYGLRVDVLLGQLYGGSWAKSEDNIKRGTAINLGENLAITTSGNQNYEASTETNLQNAASSVNWSNIGGSRMNTFTTANFDNAITVAEDSKLSGGNITLATYDNIRSVVNSQIKQKAVFGVDVVSNAVNKVTRSNKIKVASGATLDSANDLKLYAGMSKGDEASRVTIETTSEASNASVAISTRPRFEITADSVNKVTLNGAATSKSDINIVAQKGEETVTKEAIKWAWGESRDGKQIPVSASMSDVLKFSNAEDSAVDIAGKIQAGTMNNLEVKISGEQSPSSNPNYAIKFADSTGTELNYEATQGSFNYAQSLATRWNELQELIKVYDLKKNNVTAAEYAGYVQELALLEQKMTKLGLLETKNGKKTVKTSGIEVNYVALPNLSMSGGTINITSPNLKGSGIIAVNANPYAKIINNSNAWLRVNDIEITKVGEGLTVNSMRINDQSDIKTANNLMLNLSKSDKSGITIDNSGASTNKNGVPTIEIDGLIEAPQNDVTIKNPKGDITINASTDEKLTGINARNVKIEATGDFNQSYTAGTVHIGNPPEDLYKDLAAKNYELKVNKGKANKNDLKDGARIMGGIISIAADNINVSGLLQSGYDTYNAVVTKAQVDAAIKAAQNNDSSKLVVIGDKKLYKVNESGNVYDSAAKKATYNVQVYYDPETKTLITQDIDHTGGKIYLTGNIISTGNGKILAADSGADINIKNDSGVALNVGKVLNNNVEGEVNITQVTGDKLSRYTYKNASATVIDDYADYLKNPSNDKIKKLSDATKFNPTPETFYNWTTSNEVTFLRNVRLIYKAPNDKTALKLINDDKFLENLWGTGNDPKARFQGFSVKRVLETKPLKSGNSINVLNNGKDYDFLINVTLKTLSSKVASRKTPPHRVEWKAFKDNSYQFDWDVREVDKGIYINSARADYPISIGFIGKKDGSINISSNSDVTLADTIRNNSSGAKLNVSGKDIAQKSGVNIYGNHANFDANGSVTGINITALDEKKPIAFSAKASKGSIDATLTGGANLGNVTSKSQIDLTATGDITMQNSNALIKSDKVNLTSKYGKISALVNTPNLNATAYGDIDFRSNNDLRIGMIESQNGDVTLNASGGIIDALPEDAEALTSADIKKKTARWVNAGFIAGADRNNAYIRSLEQRVADYETSTREDFADWLNMKESGTNDLTADEKEIYASYEKQFGKYSDVESYLRAQEQDSESTYAQLKSEAANPEYEWTADQLLYAIDDSIINRQTGSTDTSDKVANIIGRNVTLNAKYICEPEETKTITAEQLTGKNMGKYLKQLAISSPNAIAVELDDEGKIAAFRIEGLSPVGVYATGNIKARSLNDLALSARKGSEYGNYSALKISGIQANKAILLGKVGVLDTSNGTTINSSTLTVEGGTGTIGTKKKPLTVAAKVEAARSENNIFIKSPSDLGLGAVYTPKNATFSSSKNIYKLSNLEAAQIDVSGTLTLKGKNIGAENIPLKIKSSDAISVNGNGANMFLQMPEEKVGNVTIKNTHKNGNLTLKGNINSSGNVTLRANKKILVENNVTTAGNVDIVTVKRDDLTVKGKVTAGGTTRLEAPEGQAVSGKGNLNPNKNTPQSGTDKTSSAVPNPTDTKNTASISTTDNNSSSAQNDSISENAAPLTENATAADNDYIAESVPTNTTTNNSTTNNVEVIPLKTGGKLELDLEKNKGYYFPEPDEVVNDYLQDNRNFLSDWDDGNLYLGYKITGENDVDQHFSSTNLLIESYSQYPQVNLNRSGDNNLHIASYNFPTAVKGLKLYRPFLKKATVSG